MKIVTGYRLHVAGENTKNQKTNSRNPRNSKFEAGNSKFEEIQRTKKQITRTKEIERISPATCNLGPGSAGIQSQIRSA